MRGITQISSLRWIHPVLLGRIWDRVLADDCIDLAAQMSFFFVLALFPFCLVLAVLVGWLPSTTLWRSFATWMVTYLPPESRDLVFSTAMSLANGSKGFLSLGVIGSIWSTSSGFVSLMEGLSMAYGCKDSRPFWKKHAIAIGATLIAAIFALTSFAAMAIGHWEFESALVEMTTWDPPRIVWTIGRWIAVLVIMCLAIDLINFVLPSGKRPWRWLTPGTAFVVLTTVVSSFGLNLYIEHFSSYPRIYGTLAGFVVLMMWIYIVSVILLIGAETDRELEKLAGALRPS
jgi:membrane protein